MTVRNERSNIDIIIKGSHGFSVGTYCRVHQLLMWLMWVVEWPGGYVYIYIVPPCGRHQIRDTVWDKYCLSPTRGWEVSNYQIARRALENGYLTV